MKFTFKYLLLVVLSIPTRMCSMEWLHDLQVPLEVERRRAAQRQAARPDKMKLGKQFAWVARYAGDWAEADSLIKQGADLDQRDDNGLTALTRAAANGRNKIVQTLIDAGADIHGRDAYFFTALERAAYNYHIPTCFLLVDAMLKPSEEQKDRVYAFLLCLQHMPCGQYSNLKNLFKPLLYAMIHEPQLVALRVEARQQIDQVGSTEIKQQLLEKYRLK